MEIIPDIRMCNIRILKVSAIMMSFIFTLMFALSFILPNYAANRFFYGFETVETLTVVLAAVFVLPHKPEISTPFAYFFMGLLHYYGIHVGIISQQTNLAVTSCLFLIALPLLFVDNAARIIIFTTIAAVLNAVLMIKMKSSSILIIDLTDVLFSWIMGIALGLESNSIKITSFIREHEIALERDTDGLTGLWNKNALAAKISDLMSEENAKGAFFIMDLDRFKQLNDTCGHSFGDKILVEAASCISEVFGEKDVVGRFGGDEFIFCMPGADAEAASAAAEKLLSALYSGVSLPTEDKGLHGSIGIAIYGGETDSTYDDIMIMADKALYVTKQNGRFGYTVFSGDKMERHPFSGEARNA